MNAEMIKRQIDEDKKFIRRCRNSLKGLPQGSLASYSKNGVRYYKRYEKGSFAYLGKEDPIIPKLQKRRILSKLIANAENNIHYMELLKDHYRVCDPFQIQNELTGSYHDMDPSLFQDIGVCESKALKRRFREDEKIYRTASGLKVRSRIEALIADLYTKKGITFDYEPILVLPGGIELHPDFRAYCASEHRYKYHEHIGMLQDEKYKNDFLQKMDLYISAGYMPFHDILFTFEHYGEELDLATYSILIDIFMT